MFVFTLICGLIVLLLVWDYTVKKHRNEVLKKSKIGGRFTLPILGNAFQGGKLNSETIITFLRQRMFENTKIVRVWIFNQLVVFSSDIKDIEDLLNSPIHITKNNVYDMIRVWLGDGLLVSTGKKWHTRRKIITPTFHFKILEQFVSVFDRESTVLVEKLKAKSDGQTVVDVFPLICLMALDIIAETAMGVNVDAQRNPQVEYVKAVQIATELISLRLRRPLLRSDRMFRLVAPKEYNQLMDSIKLMHNFTGNVIEKRREALQKSLNSDNLKKEDNIVDDNDIGAKKRLALLDVLLQSNVDGKPLSNADIAEEVETFMFAGHDTTTSGSSFALYLIARHAEVQNKLFEEIREVIGDDKQQPITYRQLQELKYMECVIKESLRLYPPVPIVGRYFSQDVEINKRIIPANTHFNIPIFVVLRDPDNFKDPNEFKPERFSNELQGDISTFGYIPFSAGPRNCIGQKYAMLEMKSTISKILRYYELLPLGEELIPSLSLVLRSKNGMNLGLKPRVY